MDGSTTSIGQSDERADVVYFFPMASFFGEAIYTPWSAILRLLECAEDMSVETLHQVL